MKILKVIFVCVYFLSVVLGWWLMMSFGSLSDMPRDSFPMSPLGMFINSAWVSGIFVGGPLVLIYFVIRALTGRKKSN